MPDKIGSFVLNNGLLMPRMGLGTFPARGTECVSMVRYAVEAGYRLIDTAAIYKNEEEIGQGIRQCGIPRERLFITSKVWDDDHGFEPTLKAFDASMDRLGLEYLDLYLIHWPNPAQFRESFEQTNAETWRAMEKIYRSGRARAIGVSNYLPRHLGALLKTAEVKPAVNQIRLFPGFYQAELVKYCKALGIVVEAYSPLGNGKVLTSPEIVQIAEQHGKTPPQVCVRWCYQEEVIPLPKSVSQERLCNNLDIFDFSLSAEEMRFLETMKNYGGPGDHPDGGTLEV
jgi:diketogulonate reductase-like aldo/keto reductase